MSSRKKELERELKDEEGIIVYLDTPGVPERYISMNLSDEFQYFRIRRTGTKNGFETVLFNVSTEGCEDHNEFRKKLYRLFTDEDELNLSVEAIEVGYEQGVE
jgi:hypothetical protein